MRIIKLTTLQIKIELRRLLRSSRFKNLENDYLKLANDYEKLLSKNKLLTKNKLLCQRKLHITPAHFAEDLNN